MNASENMLDQFCLKWKDFQTVISHSLAELHDFTDVTLACDDGQIQAHKFMLATCSSVFQEILRDNNHQHPWIYLRGVKTNFLRQTLTFMYTGQVEVAQPDIDHFLQVSHDLKIRGLSRPQNDENDKEPTLEDNVKTFEEDKDLSTDKQNGIDSGFNCKKEEETNDTSTISNEPPFMELDNKNEEFEDTTDSTIKDTINGMMMKEFEYWKCKECGKLMQEKNNLKRHIETHLKGLLFTCQMCKKTCKSSNSLSVHKSRFHKNGFQD